MDVFFLARTAEAIPPEVMAIGKFLITSGAGGWIVKWFIADIRWKVKVEYDLAHLGERLGTTKGCDLAPKLREKYKNKKWIVNGYNEGEK